jgi:hypothetical protein
VRGGVFKEGKSRWHITASTQRLQGVELGGGAVEGGWIRQRRGLTQRHGKRAMTGGAHLSAMRGEAGALSCDGGRNRAGH